MSSYILPNVGATGAISLQAPFGALCVPNVPYRVNGVRSLQDVVASGQDPFGLYYEPSGITAAKFAEDVAAGVCIISLISPAGDTVYVPNSYLNSLPVSTGMPYSTMLVGINLGALPDNLSLAYFMSTVSQLASDLLGVTAAQVKAVKASSTTYLTIADAAAIETTRAVVMGSVVTDRAKLIAAQAIIASLQTKNADLEAYILALAA